MSCSLARLRRARLRYDDSRSKRTIEGEAEAAMTVMAPAGTQRREQFERDGYLIARGLFPPEEAASLRDYYMEIHARRAIQGYNDGLPESDILHRYPRLVHPHRTDELSRRYMLDPPIADVL